MSLISGFEHIVRENEPLAPYTRLNIGGVAEYFAEPTTKDELVSFCLLYTSPSPRDGLLSRMPSSA